MPLCPVESFHGRAMKKTVGDSRIDRASFTKAAFVQLCSKKDGTVAANKDTTSVSQMLNEASVAEKLIVLVEGMITAISCYCLSVPDRALPSARDIVFA